MWRVLPAVLGLAVTVVPASAIEPGTCRAELARVCPNVTPGGGRILACLQAHADELSPECRARFRSAAAEHRARPGGAAADHAALASCRADVDRFCRDEPPGGGRWLACLHRHEDALSPPCRQALGIASATTTTTAPPPAP